MVLRELHRRIASETERFRVDDGRPSIRPGTAIMSNLASSPSPSATPGPMGIFDGDELDEIFHVPNEDRTRVVELVTGRRRGRQHQHRRGHRQRVRLAASAVIEDQTGEEVYVVGDDLPVPIGIASTPRRPRASTGS